MTPNQKAALRQALGTHSLGMVTKSMTPEELQELPEDYQVPTYTANASPLYDNQLFPKITSAEDLIDIGYATPDGRSTQSGQMAIALKKAGALNDDYTLNDTGKAMMANPADLLEEENLPLYLKSKELDLDGSGRELSWGETFGRFYKESKDSVKALYNIASGPAPTTKEEKAAFDLEVQAGLGGAVKAGAALAMGVAEIAGSGLIKALSDTEAEEDLALASLNQKFEKLGYQFKNAKAAEVIDGLGEMVGAELGVGEAREQNIQTVGEEKAKELEQRGESAGAFASMFNPYGAAAMTGKVAFGVAGKGLGAAFRPISRSLLQADIKAAQVLDKTKQLAALQRQASGLQVATQAAEKKAVFAESMAQRLSQAGLVDRANNALRIANQFRTTGQEAATRLGGFTDEIATVSDDLAKATQSANVADKVLQVTQKARQIPYLPITALGKTLEATGRGMIGIDKGLSSLASKIGADKAYNAMNKITALSGLGGAGAALGLGPAAFIPAAIRATWSTAPFIKATGEYISLVGKEATKARGQIGFWKRIYEMPNKGPAHRAVSGLMDTATMGGRIPGAVSNVAKGLVASYPVDLAYEWVSEGGDFNPNILKQAAVETLFFGGTGAALGGITMGGANRIKTLQNGDALNFYRSISDPSQRVMYNGMPSDMKRVIGTFSASNPGAKIQFVDQGAGAYDRNTKTVMVNPNAANPLKPLLTHEFMHHMLNNGIGDGVVAQLVGDGFQTGGLLRGRDGSYDPQYEAFKDEYVNRLRSQHERTVKMRDAIGDPMTKSEREFQTPDEKYLAEEYFIEVNVDDMLGMAESGKLGSIAGRMIINDKARALGDAILNKSAILRDLHFRIGGVMDNKGKMVTGNGFLSGKLYQSPEVRRMFQKMVNESVGRKGGVDAAKRKARNGIEIPVTGNNDPILGEVSSLWETDADGNPYLDASGEYIPLKKETDELRSQAGMLLVDDLKARQARGEVIPDGELSYNPDNNTWSGQYLNDRQIELLNLSGRFNSKQIKQLKLLNAAARDTSNTTSDPAARGHRFSVIYQPALKKNRKGQWRYDQIKPQLRDVVPYGVEISKDGNILIRVMSTNQLFANASEKSASKRGRALYDGNMETILRDVNAVIDSHGKNQPTDAYFKDKYGGQWEQHKSFINSVFGNVGAGQKDINPLVASDRVDAVVKSYRLDRMNKATQLVGSTQLPYQNNLVKINYLPEGEPIMDANGEPKDLRYTPKYEPSTEQARQMPESLDADYMKAVDSGDMESAQRMVDEAARKAGYDIENIAYHGTNIDFNNFDISDKIGVWTGAESTASLFSRIRASRSGSPRVIKGYIKAQNTAPAGQDLEVSGEDAIRQREKLIADGFDSIESPGKFKIVLSPEQIKSADPITRDDSGNVIPLSQRFNEKSSDIRYMPEGEPDIKVIQESNETTEPGTPAPDSDVESIPLTGKPIPWGRSKYRQVSFMPESDRDAFPTMTPEMLSQIKSETPTLAAIHIDRMRVGEYMGVDLQGGMFYPTIKENLDKNVAWAFNSQGVARGVARRAAQNGGYVKLVLMQEGNVVGNKTFANIWFNILDRNIEAGKMSKEAALARLNLARDTVYKKIGTKDKKRNPWVDSHSKQWDTLGEAKDAILAMPQIERGATYFQKSKTTTKAEGEKISYGALLSKKMTTAGFPDAIKIVEDIEEPAFKGIPTGAAVAILKFDALPDDAKVQTAKEAGVPEHMSYGYVLKGRPVAKLGYYQVVDETFPKTKGQIMTQQNTDFPVSKSVPSKKTAKGQIEYERANASAIANAVSLR